jgi:hypothetical protein
MEFPTTLMLQHSEEFVHPDSLESGRPSHSYQDDEKFINHDDWQKTEPTLTDFFKVLQVQEDPFADPNGTGQQLELYPGERMVSSLGRWIY